MKLKLGNIEWKRFVGLGLLLVLLLLNSWQILTRDKLATIDAERILHLEAEKLAALYPKGNVPEMKLQQLVNRLRETVETYAQKNKIILLSKNAVLGGNLPDDTEAVLRELKEKEPL